MASSSSSSFSLNQDAVNEFRKIQDWNNSFSLEDELHFEDMNDCSATSFNYDSYSSLSSIGTRKSKFHGPDALVEKSLKEKSPDSVDRGLRVQGWVGGHTPTGFKKPRRSWKAKNPSDEISFMKK